MGKILLIDDAMTVRMYHRQILEQGGYSVDEAENGIEAIEKALSEKYELYLVDINMPKMDGYSFLTEVRQREELLYTPAIMISTEAREGDREKAFQSGATTYMVKPVKPDALLCTVALLMSGAAA
ncbi:MAG: response regulator [Robiginitomaculum sp.]|nr:response regulator [Robiginitomaculum sp.]